MDLDMIVMQAMDPVFAFQKYLVDKMYLFTAARGEEQLGGGKRLRLPICGGAEIAQRLSI